MSCGCCSSPLDELLIKRDEINTRLPTIIDEVTNPWGVEVSLVEVKDVNLPESMQRAMGRQAEAERERRTKVIHALGESQAAQNLGEAALVLEQHPGAMQLKSLLARAQELGHVPHIEVKGPPPALPKGHPESTDRFYVTCSCGYQAAKRRTQKTAVEVVLWHPGKAVGEVDGAGAR